MPSKFRKSIRGAATAALVRWHEEIEAAPYQAPSHPLTRIGDACDRPQMSSQPPRGAASLTPLVARTDHTLRLLREVDAGVHELLLAHARGAGLKDIARETGLSVTAVREGLTEGLAIVGFSLLAKR